MQEEAIDMNSSALNIAKTQLRSVMKQRLAGLPPDSITAQSMYVTNDTANILLNNRSVL